jgi:hypothetical protein
VILSAGIAGDALVVEGLAELVVDCVEHGLGADVLHRNGAEA